MCRTNTYRRTFTQRKIFTVIPSKSLVLNPCCRSFVWVCGLQALRFPYFVLFILVSVISWYFRFQWRQKRGDSCTENRPLCKSQSKRENKARHLKETSCNPQMYLCTVSPVKNSCEASYIIIVWFLICWPWFYHQGWHTSSVKSPAFITNIASPQKKVKGRNSGLPRNINFTQTLFLLLFSKIEKRINK